MLPIGQSLVQEAAESKCNPTPRPSPSTSEAGIEYELKDLPLADDGNIARYPPSVDTDPPLSAHTNVNRELFTTLESISWVLANPSEPAQTQSLTRLALEAHNLNTKDSDYARSLADWLHDGDLFDYYNPHTKATESMFVNTPSRSHTPESTDSSFDVLRSFDPMADIDHDLSEAGAIFHEIPGPTMDDEPILASGQMDRQKGDTNSQPTASVVVDKNPGQPGVATHSKPQADFVKRVKEQPNSQSIVSPALDEDTNQPVATTQTGPPLIEHGCTDLPKEATSLPHHPWIAAAWYWIAAVLDPPPEGAYRATYTCGCGELCYIDLEDLIPGGAAELEEEIRKEADTIRYRNPGGEGSSRDNIRPPAQAHISCMNLSRTEGQRAPVEGLPSLAEQSQGGNITGITTQDQAIDIAALAQKFLLLCINTKHGLVKLVHIDVSDLTNDQFLFQEIRNEYKIARCGHDWNLKTLFPDKKKIPGAILKLMSMIWLRNIKFPQWINSALQDCRLFIPRKIEFIKFELMPVRLEIYAGNIEKPEIPGAEEVQVKKTYEYEPITMKAKILKVPIHELLKPGLHLNRYWWRRFPKKLDHPLTFDENSDCYGWGILISEGWNKPFILILCLLATVLFVIFVVLYSIFTDDGSTGAGIGSFMMAILTLYCTLKYEQWKEQ